MRENTTLSREGTMIHDGEVTHPGGCPRGRKDCGALARVASPGYASFMCCGETDAAPVPTDRLRLCILSTHDRGPVDLMVNLDDRDAIDTASVLLAGLSSHAQVTAFGTPSTAEVAEDAAHGKERGDGK